MRCAIIFPGILRVPQVGYGNAVQSPLQVIGNLLNVVPWVYSTPLTRVYSCAYALGAIS
jgi:hypothetical protein